MKKITTFLALSILLLIANVKLNAQCTITNTTVEIVNTQISGADCLITFTLSFDLENNSGNKYIHLHLWETSQYPNPAFVYKTSFQPNATDLANTIKNIVIDNNTGGQPVFLNVYAPAPTVPVVNTTTNPDLSIVTVPTSNPAVTRFIISNLKITRTGACNNSLTFKADFWSSQAASANATHCWVQGFSLGITDPVLTGNVNCGFYDVAISTTSATKSVYYDVYVDGSTTNAANNIFDQATDTYITTVGSIGSPIIITQGTPYNPAGFFTLPAPFNAPPYLNRKVFIIVKIVGETYLIQETLTPVTTSCGVAPILLTDFYAYRKTSSTVQLSWKTQTEINAKGFEIERKTDNGYVKVGYVAAKNIQNGASYSFQDNNSGKSISLYRLKMIDIDGSSKLSEVRSVKGNATTNDFTIFPNPSTGSTKVSITDIEENTDVQLIDNSGRVLKTIPIASTNIIELNKLQRGIYLVRIVNKNTGIAVTKKLTVIQ